MDMHFYWSDDLSSEYFIAMARAGFIAISRGVEEDRILLPEIQYSYALLDFSNLHVSRKVEKLLSRKSLHIELSTDLEPVFRGIEKQHADNWMTRWYQEILLGIDELDESFQVLAVAITEKGQVVAGEISYSIGRVYTSLSGFCSREKQYSNYGTAQLVLLARFLEANQFAFWNLGHPSFSYKIALGAEVLERQDFLARWLPATQGKLAVKIKNPQSYTLPA